MKLLPLFLLLLLVLACGGGAVWQSESRATPRFEAALPDFLIQREDTSTWRFRPGISNKDVLYLALA